MNAACWCDRMHPMDLLSCRKQCIGINLGALRHFEELLWSKDSSFNSCTACAWRFPPQRGQTQSVSVRGRLADSSSHQTTSPALGPLPSPNKPAQRRGRLVCSSLREPLNMKRARSATRKSQTAQARLGDNGVFVVSSALCWCEPRAAGQGERTALNPAWNTGWTSDPPSLPAAEKPPFSCKWTSFVPWG